MMKKTNIHYSDEEEEEELNTSLAKDVMFQKHTKKLRILQHHRNKDIYDSDSEFDTDEKIDTNGDSSIEYKTNNFQIDLSEYTKLGKSFNDVHSDHDALEVKEQSIINKLKDAQLQRMSDHILDNLYIENREVPQQSSKKNWPDRQQFLENNEIENSSIDIEKEDYMKEKDEIYLKDNPVYTDASYNKIYCDINKNEEMKNLSSPKSRKAKKSSPQVYGEEYTTNSDENNRPAYNLQLEEEYLRPRVEEKPNAIQSNEETLNTSDLNVETKNKLNASLETGNVDISTNIQSQIEQTNSIKVERIDNKQINDKKKVINYDKEKLLATMKAIDDNENIEYLNQGFKNHNTNRMQITENLYRGLPTHSKPKRDIIKDMFEDNHIENKVRGTCSKSH